MTREIKYISPVYVIFISMILCFLFTLVPPDVYVKYMHEPDFMFLNFELYAFIVFCFLLLFIGYILAIKSPILKLPNVFTERQIPALLYLLVPVFLSLLLVLITQMIIIKNDPSILIYALDGDGSMVKSALAHGAGHGALTGSIPLAMGIAWWAYMRISDESRIFLRTSLINYFAIAVLSFLLITLFSLMAARYLLMPFLMGFILIHFRKKLLSGRFSLLRLAFISSIIVFFIVLLFYLFSLYRGAGDSRELTEKLIGYGPTSINHLAALLNGRLGGERMSELSFKGDFSFIYHLPFASRLFDVDAHQVSDFFEWFTIIRDAGLNGGYIWFTSFGAILSGLGVLMVPYLLIYGFILGRAWMSFIRGGVFGALLYPWTAFCVFFSFGSNYFASRDLSYFFILAFIIWIYEGFYRPSFSTRRVST